ncbi:MAG: hypothetical protein ACI83D_000597, partial [Planctomycetota bacterium]
NHSSDTATIQILNAPTGGSWETIASNIPLREMQYVWNIPETFYGEKVQIRMIDSSGQTLSKQGPFSVLERPTLHLDGGNLLWQPIAGATKYHVYQLLGGDMVHIDTTRTPQYYIGDLDTKYVSVMAEYENGGQSLRSVATKTQ